MRDPRMVLLFALVLALAVQLVPPRGVHATPVDARLDQDVEARFADDHARELRRAEQDDEPRGGRAVGRAPVRPATVQRGGQTFNTVAYVTEPGPDGREIGSGTLLVKFKASADQAGRSNAHRAAGALAVDTLAALDVQRIQVRHGAVRSAPAAYRARADVEYAEPDYVVRRAFTPSDPLLGQQWGLTKIGAQQAWDSVTGSGAIHIAILVLQPQISEAPCIVAAPRRGLMSPSPR